MDTIFSYVESVFINLPRTPEMEQLKRDMLLNMEEKYEELKASGCSENEVIGIVLSEFGNIDEIIEEYDIEQELPQEEENEQEDIQPLSSVEAESYLHRRTVFGAGIGLGVVLCILAPASLFMMNILLGSLSKGLGVRNQRFDVLNVLALFAFLAMGIGILVILGIRESQQEKKGNMIRLLPSARSDIKKSRKAFQSSFALAIASGVILCLLAPVSLLLSIAFLGAFGNDIGLVFLLSFIALGVFLFIYYGVVNAAYDRLLSLGEYTPEKQERTRKSEAAAEIVFPLLGLIYVASGFLFDSWGTAWIIFPIAGIGFAAYEVIMDGLDSFKKNKK